MTREVRMGGRALCLIAAIGLALPPELVAGPASDPDVVKGVAQVDDGDYDGAILTLDNAARRLATSGGSQKDLAEAYLYLGVAYMGKGAETSAKARFRDALGQVKDLSLSPEKFPPKVINLFEAAKEEVDRTPGPAPSAATSSSPVPEPPEKKGGGKALWILGGVAAVGGGIALAAGSSKSPSTPQPSPSPTGTTTSTFSGSVGPANSSCNAVNLPQFTPSRAGTLDATLTWQDASQVLGFTLDEAGNGNVDATSQAASNTSAKLTAQVKNISYGFSVCLAGTGGVVEAFTIMATYPQ
jgi:hypothetical protein